MVCYGRLYFGFAKKCHSSMTSNSILNGFHHFSVPEESVLEKFQSLCDSYVFADEEARLSWLIRIMGP